MNNTINALIESARQGDWTPLLETAREVPGKNWPEKALCSGLDFEDDFFPESEHPWSDPDQIRESHADTLRLPLALCSACPLSVAARCLVDALRYEDRYGIRAGLLAPEREDLLSLWKTRVNAEAVAAVLQGVTTLLNSAERTAVIAQVAEDPEVDAHLAARGLGIPIKYLWQLVREHKKRSTNSSLAEAA
ncbi:WhiB family transcriptional regulator [Streptomyces niveiscabiei]|uniref:WhiB family transcriptional regulator n=1 Tax=Streptomyces niveiscabiei TaxID=164115 RepID=UPI0029ABA160|nr:WhiB family transcriptional regulator [Streptomyces niveiscabiei]MDX3388180.1 WhiB family transcriptional regulator [Streptomyces niveiscabiei]